MLLPLHVSRKPLIMFVCALLLCGGVLLIPHLAHAAVRPFLPHDPNLCADTPTVQNCNRTDPITAGCLFDARSVDTERAVHKGVVVGYVTLRASTTCHTYWVKSVAYGHSGVISTLTAISYDVPGDPVFPPGAGQTDPGERVSDGSILNYTDMAFRMQPPGTAQSTFSMSDGTTVTVQV